MPSKAEDIISRHFMTPVLLQYEPPKHVAGHEVLEDTLKALIVRTAAGVVPRDWPADRIIVFAQRLWGEWLLGNHYGSYWPRADEVLKASVKIMEDMTRYDARAVLNSTPLIEDRTPDDFVLMGEEGDFPAFYARMRPEVIANPGYVGREPLLRMLAEGKRRWMMKHGKWPIDEDEAPIDTCISERSVADRSTASERSVAEEDYGSVWDGVNDLL